MPIPVIAAVVLYALLRQIIMAIVSGAIVTAAQEVLDGTFKELVYEIKDTQGVTEQDAKDIVANILLDLAVNSASIMFILRSGAGVKVAEWLGLASRKYGKAALTPAAEVAASKIAQDGGKSLSRKLLPRLVKVLGKGTGIFWLFAALTQIVEPLWYQPGQIQRVLNGIGIDVDVPGAAGTQAPGPFSADSSVTFSDFAKSIEAAGVKGINNPAALQSQLYTRENLANLVNYVYGQNLLQGKNLKVADLLPLLSKYLVGGTLPSSVPSPTASVTTSPSIPKVYTGIVSQGVIGKGLSFTPRPDDLIESVEELRQAAANNLAPFLQAVIGKIIYEVKIVSSVITKDGFRQTGTVQQIRNGSYTNGTPKYKTVVNKFATLNLYILTDKGVRSKISTIILGPTNSAKLTIGVNDVREVETSLPSLVTTTDINEIKGIETAQSVTVSTPKSDGGTSTPDLDTGPVVTSASPVSTPATATPVAGNNASTLFDWYQAQGLPLPSVSDRSTLYESFGLGQRSYYTGSAEQNSKLLAALKAQAAQKAQSTASSQSSSTASSQSSSIASNKDVPSMKGKKVNISSSKIKEKKNSKGETYATIDGSIFSVSEYKEFKKLRSKYT